jgi:hypothetical protein
MSIARLVTVGLVRAGIRAATTGSADSPQAIMADAEDPNVPAAEVMARAAARSTTGSLVRAASEAIARRPSLAQRIFGE